MMIMIIIITTIFIFYQPDGIEENEICKILWGMTIQCDHIIKPRRPDVVVVTKESNKAIIVDIASPWDHRVYEKESENTEKCQDLKKEIITLWGIRRVEVAPVVVGALGAVSKRLDVWLIGLTSWGLPLIPVYCRKQLCSEQQGS